MINLNNYQKHDEPYPLIIFDNFFEENFLQKILAEFPSIEEFIKFKKTMVNRRFLSNENPDFYKYINTNKSWKEFYENVNTKVFFSKILNLLVENNSQNHKKFSTLVYKENLYKKSNLKFNFMHYVRESIQSLPRNRVINYLRDNIKSKINLASNRENNCYLRLDISSASNGYNRKPHKDSDGTIIAFLIYLEDKNNIGGTGGNFIINDNSMKKIKELEPKKNRAVFFLSNKNSYHSVSEMKFANGWRKFIYGGFTSRNKNIWKD